MRELRNAECEEKTKFNRTEDERIDQTALFVCPHYAGNINGEERHAHNEPPLTNCSPGDVLQGVERSPGEN